MKQEYEKNLISKTVWYYYSENLTQQQIASILGISRSRVVNLLEKAKQTGVIKFVIRQDSDRRMEIEHNLIKKYNLKDVFVVPTPENPANLNETIAKAAAMYVGTRLETGGYLNMGYGDTLSRTLNHLATMVEKPINVVSLTGGVSYYLPNNTLSTFNAKLFLIPCPLLLSSGEMRDAMLNEPSVNDIKRMHTLSQMSVVGIGSMSEDATIIKNGILNKNDFTLLNMHGAVGDILSHFIDKDGNSIESSINQRLISTSLETLSNLKNVVGVAAGKEKIEAIKAVLNKEYLDILITDEQTATDLLSDA